MQVLNQNVGCITGNQLSDRKTERECTQVDKSHYLCPLKIYSNQSSSERHKTEPLSSTVYSQDPWKTAFQYVLPYSFPPFMFFFSRWGFPV